MDRIFFPQSEFDTEQLGASVGARLSARVILLLTGPLGAGKTTFVRGLVREYSPDPVSSPTYVYHQRYATHGLPIDHVDLYRAQSNPTMINQTGLVDLFETVPGWLIIEWPEPNTHYANDVPILSINASGAPDYSFQVLTNDPALGHALGDL